MKESEKKYIDETLEIMKKILSDEPQEMTTQIREAEGKVGYLYFLLAASNAELDRQTSAAAEVIKKQDVPAYVLKAKTESAVSGFRQERDEIQGLIKSLEGRTMTGLGILKYWKQLPQV